MASSSNTNPGAAAVTPSFPELLGTEIVELFIGKEKKLLRVHKALLCQKVPYFAKMFQGGFKEAAENSATFPDDSEESFGLLIEWVYTGKVRPLAEISIDKVLAANWSMINFYTLAEKICLTNLKDQILDCHRLYQTGRNELWDFPRMRKAWNTTAENSGLRRYAKDSLIYIFMAAKHPSALTTWTTSGLVEMAVEDNQLFVLTLDAIRTHSHDGTKPTDPRQAATCHYHSHGKDEVCLVKKAV
ncbi:Kelch repeat and BTB domain-containing protein [Lachnellula occidentalis]|uniref:Kelch repeat and BTB domain-containing protein n=1 Tax=Lachnellula occidentalis TaxID=215460 RepID=A0A8H8RK83_9HELO|nr:Kelch repeat and BTB domain-containing protein [Lachnellula occidentalis]